MHSLNDTALESNKYMKINFSGGDLSSDAGLLYPNRTKRRLKNPYKAHKYRLCRDLPLYSNSQIKSLLSVKDSRDILISVDHTINLYILVSHLVDNHIIFPYRIFIVCPKADSSGKI